MENSNSQKYLCIKYIDVNNGVIDPALSRCPANPEMVMASLQFLVPDYRIEISIQNSPIDFFKEVGL